MKNSLGHAIALCRKYHLPASVMGLLLLSFLLLVFWSVAVPVGQAPDEGSHAQYVNYAHLNGRPPIYKVGFNEANQPPIYYFMISPFAPEAAWLPWSWSIHCLRVITALMSVLTVLFCYWIGFEATRNETTGLFAAGLTAFLPQFTFRGMNVSNDALVTLMSAIATLWIVRLIRRGFSRSLGLNGSVTIALAFLSKVNSLFFPIPFSLAILSESAPWKKRLSRLSVLGLSLIVPLPWLIYNQLLYGDPLASQAMLTVVSHLVDIKPIISPYFTSRFPIWTFQSFVGLFGWMNLWMPDWIYLFFAFLFALAALGYLRRLLSRDIDLRLSLILLTIPFLSLAVTIYINLTFTQPQGRYLFPALPAIAFLTASGLEGLPAWSKRATFGALITLGLLNIFVLFTTVIAAYRLPF